MWITLLFDWEASKGGIVYSGRGRVQVKEADAPEEVKHLMVALVEELHRDCDDIDIFHIREANKWSVMED